MSTKLEITMKSGATVIVDVETFTLKGMAGSARSFEWTTPETGKRRRLVSIALDEMAAMVEVLS